MAKQSLQQGDLITRIEALERAVFGVRSKTGAKRESRGQSADSFKGATGGLRLLISKGFFDRRRKFSEIEGELNKQGYHYSKQAIQTPLNRLSKHNGPLVGLKQQGHKVYAKRK
jgi:hypothetical protein